MYKYARERTTYERNSSLGWYERDMKVMSMKIMKIIWKQFSVLIQIKLTLICHSKIAYFVFTIDFHYYWFLLLFFLIFIWQSLLFDLQFLACTFGSARHLALQMLAFSLDWHPNSVALQCTFRGKQVFVRACLHWGGEPQVGEVTRLGGVTRLPFWSPHLSCKQDQIKVRDYVDRRVTPPKRVTSPTRGPPPSCKQAVGLFAL